MQVKYPVFFRHHFSTNHDDAWKTVSFHLLEPFYLSNVPYGNAKNLYSTFYNLSSVTPPSKRTKEVSLTGKKKKQCIVFRYILFHV